MAAAAIFKIIMKTITFQDLWQLLQPTVVFNTRGRYEHCLRVWGKMDETQRARVYQRIEEKQHNGEFVHPNPCFALDDAMQEDECAHAKKRQRTPEFLDGDEGGDLVQVMYNGKYKICTRQTMNEFNLRFVKDW